jgi:hypothetical protein
VCGTCALLRLLHLALRLAQLLLLHTQAYTQPRSGSCYTCSGADCAHISTCQRWRMQQLQWGPP